MQSAHTKVCNKCRRTKGIYDFHKDKSRRTGLNNICKLCEAMKGKARLYPYTGGFGPQDKTLDLNIACYPDFMQDARDPYPTGFKAILCDPPYSPEDAAQYPGGAEVYPKPNTILHNALDALEVGCRVGIIHYMVPQPKQRAKFIACVGVVCGFNNRIRVYTVFEKLA